MIEKIKNSETIRRINTETSPYFKPFKYAGGMMLVVSVGIEAAALFTPAMPLAAVSLAGKLFTIGGLLFAGSSLTVNPQAPPESNNEKPTLLGTLKNLIYL
jgi:hypothetical protein